MIDEKLKAGNVINLDLDTPIYKYIPFKYLKLMIQNSNLYFGKVSSWEDVYENWFLKEQMVLPTGEKGDAMDLIPGVFGQSWTLQEESDAMWRIYSKLDRTQHDYLDDTAVRIKTTARKLYNVIYANDEDFYTSYIGAVKYLSQDDFLKMQDSLSPLNPLDLSEVFVKSYFFKRAPFEHEKEVRPILIYSPKHENFGKDGVSFDIDFDNLIDEMVTDPRLIPDEYRTVRGQLIGLGAKSDKVRNSELYNIPPHIIHLL